MGLNSGLDFCPRRTKYGAIVFDAVQRPTQPSDRVYVPLPGLPDSIPVAVTTMPSLPTEVTWYAPFGLTPPLTP